MIGAPAATIGAASPTLPIASEITPGSLREDHRGMSRTSIRGGVAATVAHYRKN